jgi:hypothetical protein
MQLENILHKCLCCHVCSIWMWQCNEMCILSESVNYHIYVWKLRPSWKSFGRPSIKSIVRQLHTLSGTGKGCSKPGPHAHTSSFGKRHTLLQKNIFLFQENCLPLICSSHSRMPSDCTSMHLSHYFASDIWPHRIFFSSLRLRYATSTHLLNHQLHQTLVSSSLYSEHLFFPKLIFNI